MVDMNNIKIGDLDYSLHNKIQLGMVQPEVTLVELVGYEDIEARSQ